MQRTTTRKFETDLEADTDDDERGGTSMDGRVSSLGYDEEFETDDDDFIAREIQRFEEYQNSQTLESQQRWSTLSLEDDDDADEHSALHDTGNRNIEHGNEHDDGSNGFRGLIGHSTDSQGRPTLDDSILAICTQGDSDEEYDRTIQVDELPSLLTTSQSEQELYLRARTDSNLSAASSCSSSSSIQSEPAPKTTSPKAPRRRTKLTPEERFELECQKAQAKQAKELAKLRAQREKELAKASKRKRSRAAACAEITVHFDSRAIAQDSSGDVTAIMSSLQKGRITQKPHSYQAALELERGDSINATSSSAGGNLGAKALLKFSVSIGLLPIPNCILWTRAATSTASSSTPSLPSTPMSTSTSTSTSTTTSSATTVLDSMEPYVLIRIPAKILVSWLPNDQYQQECRTMRNFFRGTPQILLLICGIERVRRELKTVYNRAYREQIATTPSSSSSTTTTTTYVMYHWRC